MSDPTHTKACRGIGLMGLIALVISSSIGSGVFALSSDVAQAAAPGPALIAWVVVGIGFMALATTFGRLSTERSDLNGLIDYAREGFGNFAGFISGWGYWLSIWIGAVAFGVMFITALGYFIPALQGNLGIPGVVIISVVNWLLIALVNRGVEEASIVNAVVMCCKLVPIFVFIVAMAVVFDGAVFTEDFWGTLHNNIMDGSGAGTGSAQTQIINCLMVMMWVFVGMEGATVLGHRARNRRDVSRATVLGCTALVVIYVAASILPYGYLPRAEIAAVGAPSMPLIFSLVAGDAGGAFITAGLLISILGAWLSYTMLASEAMLELAEMKLLPPSFAKLNVNGAPTLSLIVTGTMTQLLAVLVMFSSEAYQFAYSLCTASIVISWALATAYMVRYARAHRTEPGMRRAGLVAAFACLFLVAAVTLAGLHLLALCCVAYVPGIWFYIRARRKYGDETPLDKPEKAIAALIAIAAIAALILLALGVINI